MAYTEAEVDVNYASVVFKSDKQLQFRGKADEESLYSNIKLEKDDHAFVTEYGRCCEACETGWKHFAPHCYLFNDTDRKTWDAARKECVGKNSQLALVENERDKEFIQENCRKSNSTLGYWLGLKMVSRQWKWLDSTAANKTQISWIPDTDSIREGWCAISVAEHHNSKPKAVKCRDRHWWICKKMALVL
ncbi:CD209 antigen-like protein A isoform X4 [Corythoichthys intestinalis]|uniref:CD209 antigen-like protein A isoform X4 n=1 Tax=Corythoichthys intestinalis TaxID=161448 RepID=UPI0025A4DE75|nr:CD209 antigen-like protein A isoform X4 [Corythoichthys intestinalis]